MVNGEAWRGRGQSFRLELVPGTQISRCLVSWQNPYFMNTNFNLGLQRVLLSTFYQDWTENRTGGQISIGRLLSRYWSMGLATRLEEVDIYGFRTPAPTKITDVAGNISFDGAGDPDLRHPRLAVPAVEGHMIEGSYEQGFGNFVYPHADIQASQYFTVRERPDGFGKHILQFRGEIGYVGENAPVYERLFAGGYSSFRGFQFRGVSPRELGFAVGGQFLMVGTAEYMVPITADDNIRAVVFSDFGTVDNKVSVDHFRVTAGFGFRLAIPAMGPAPIAIDFAWPIVSERDDRLRVFSFYVGFTR
ncbi:MAG: BamA/TamA family outer membrane protein [Planctomycetaceae bacterium]